MTGPGQTGFGPGNHPAGWWRTCTDGRIECQLCPRACKLRDGQRGFCRVRARHGARIELEGYGRTAGLQVDPIEKKPLYHFLPGTRALSLGTVGCNLGCRFCQNWRVSKAKDLALLSTDAMPAQIATLAASLRCSSVAFTYNDPVVFAEYAMDTARACHDQNIKTIAVTAGYISAAAREEFFAVMDTANVDLKGFTDDFYRRWCSGRLQPVLDTLRYLYRETSVWLEVTTLLIPGANDSVEEIDRASDWFAAELGCDVPWHFTAYHPDYLLPTPPTPLATLRRARDIARSKGLKYVYLGNTHDRLGAHTWCAACGALLIERQGYEITRYNLRENRCPACRCEIAGNFEFHSGGR